MHQLRFNRRAILCAGVSIIGEEEIGEETQEK
jgi:hypothetical protein